MICFFKNKNNKVKNKTHQKTEQKPQTTPNSYYPYLQNVISRFYISNINPLAIYISVVSIVAAGAQSLKNEDGCQKNH